MKPNNSFIFRLRSREKMLKTNNKSSKKHSLKYVGCCPVDVCPRCGKSDGSHRSARFYLYYNTVTERVYSHYIQVAHYLWKGGKRVCLRVCYVRRNVGFDSGLPIDAPVLEHFYKIREGNPAYMWGYRPEKIEVKKFEDY